MNCPHCTKHIHDDWWTNPLSYQGNFQTGWLYRMMKCPACMRWIINISDTGNSWQQVEPIGSSRAPIPPSIPSEIAADYREACVVLPFSPKASAALARRCLQHILQAQGYRGGDLAKQIDALLGETDARKAIPEALRQTIDGIRNFGNFSAHPITDTTTLQVIDVEAHEAEWCLDLIEEMFEHYYVRPAAALARKAALDAKLRAAGKPESKG